MLDKINKLMDKKSNISKELIDTYKCRIMGFVNTFNITLLDHDYTYTKSIVHKEIGGGCVLPVDSNGIVYLETQYRFNLRRILLELPAGRVDENESFLECAKRELGEETGLSCEKLVEEYEYYIQPDFTDEKTGSFLALNVNLDGEQKLDADEHVNVLQIPFDICIELVKRNVIVDERTIAAIGLAKFFSNINLKVTENKEEVIEKILNKLKEDEEALKEEEIDIDYTYVCEFGFVQDHIVKTPTMKNTRRECMYMKSGSIVLPVSKQGKIGIKVKFMPAIEQNAIQLPVYEEFDEKLELKDFGYMVTAIGYANDVQKIYLLSDLEENEEYLWVTTEETLELIERRIITDGRLIAALLKYLLSLK